jgi:hypothetical protein
MEHGGGYEAFKAEVFKPMPFPQLLKIYKYFSWADKKLHQVFYIENKDDISEDLLSDFKEESGSKKGPLKHSKDAAMKQALGPAGNNGKGTKETEAQ